MRIAVSFEFFPPSDTAACAEVEACLQRLAPFAPRYVSVTCGADGSTRERTREFVARLKRASELALAPHLTCVGESQDTLLRRLGEYGSLGVRHLVALRGDPPRADAQEGGADAREGGGGTHPVAGCGRRFAHASELVAAVADAAPGVFEIAVAAYPEGHPESAGIDADVANLARKVAAGATRAITQFCFDTEAIVRYRDRCEAAGVRVPIVPGILPIQRFDQLRRFAARCGASLPRWLCDCFDGLDLAPETRRLAAAHVAIEQIEALKREGFEEFHFYTLNRADPTAAVCRAVGVRTSAPESAQIGSASERASGVKSTGPVALMCQQSSSRTPNAPGM